MTSRNSKREAAAKAAFYRHLYKKLHAYKRKLGPKTWGLAIVRGAVKRDVRINHEQAGL